MSGGKIFYILLRIKGKKLFTQLMWTGGSGQRLITLMTMRESLIMYQSKRRTDEEAGKKAAL